jgi:dTDP-4-amino-4,6-dideoxygalactose transaminase
MKVPAASIYFPPEDRAAILSQIDEILQTGQLTLGKYGRQFEEQFAAKIGVKHAIAVSSGTSAIEIPLRALGVEGKEVLVPTNTFFATPAAVLHAGGRLRFIDTDPATMSVDVDHLRASIGPETAGVIVVHIGGIVTPHMDAIRALCDEHNIWLFEDAAHAQGSMFDGRSAGTWGNAASFSFYPTKVMTSAEGGMIVTNDDRIAEEALIYRDQGKAGFLTNFHTRLGNNWRMSEVHAVIGLSQLGRLDEFIAHRNHIAEIYDEGLPGLPDLTPVRPPENGVSCDYKYPVLLPAGVDRAAFKQRLREEWEVSCSGEVYDVPCHEQPVFAEWKTESLPHAEDVCGRHLCLPISATMTEEQARHVLTALTAVLSEQTVGSSESGVRSSM